MGYVYARRPNYTSNYSSNYAPNYIDRTGLTVFKKFPAACSMCTFMFECAAGNGLKKLPLSARLVEK